MSEESGEKPLRVLIIEDEEADYELILRALAKGGLTIEAGRADSHGSFNRALDTGRWDAVLSDFNLPTFNALKALELLRSRKLVLPFLVVSGAVGEEIAVKLMQAGAEDFVMKSNLSRLAPALERSLRDAESRRREETARKTAEQAIRDREEMLAIVTHDLKNPLGAIRLNLHLISRTVAQPDGGDRDRKVLTQVERALRSAERMSSLIEDVLDVAKIEAGRFGLQRSRSRPDELISEVLELYQPIAIEKSILFETDVPADGVEGWYDHQRVFQVLSNLVGNGLKFTPERGRICLSVSSDNSNQELVFRVTDTGPGIPVEHQPHLFDRYWQASASDHRGLGLGLAIAKGIVDAHGGRIWVESAPGKGSAFCFSLPAGASV